MVATPKGFVTEEVRRKGSRVGFDIVTFDGRRSTLARVGGGHPRVGRYGVDIAGFERVLETLGTPSPDETWIIDEVGKMECLSARFLDLVRVAIESGSRLLATVPVTPLPVVLELRERAALVIELPAARHEPLMECPRVLSLLRSGKE